MTFISYAQNLEDVMLWRVFKDIEKGFYIDVGAQDPVVDSVTKGFYDRGWRGINIEPVKQYYEKLCTQRAEDINLNFAISEKIGLLPYYEIPDTGLSTLDKNIAEMHQSKGWVVQEKEITVMTLEDVCQDLVKENQIHFLKIDVEGAEKKVLLGMNFKIFRPWVVVAEATLPLSQDESYAEWEYILFENDYQFVYFDGLNRFYLAEEHAELASKFCAPPNIYDGYLRDYQSLLIKLKEEFDMHTYTLEFELAKQVEQTQHFQHANQALQNSVTELECKLTEAQSKEVLLQQILDSKSWRITKPLRESMAALKKINFRANHTQQKESVVDKQDEIQLFVDLLKQEILKKRENIS